MVGQPVTQPRKDLSTVQFFDSTSFNPAKRRSKIHALFCHSGPIMEIF